MGYLYDTRTLDRVHIFFPIHTSSPYSFGTMATTFSTADLRANWIMSNTEEVEETFSDDFQCEPVAAVPHPVQTPEADIARPVPTTHVIAAPVRTVVNPRKRKAPVPRRLFAAPTELPANTVTEPGFYFMVLGPAPLPTVKALRDESGKLFISPTFCLMAAGVKNAHAVMRRFYTRFGQPAVDMMVYNGDNSHPIGMASLEECVRILGLYMIICQKDKSGLAGVIDRLRAYSA